LGNYLIIESLLQNDFFIAIRHSPFSICRLRRKEQFMFIRLGLLLILIALAIFFVYSKRRWAILITTAGLLVITYIILIVIGGMNQWDKENKTPSQSLTSQTPQQMVDAFIEEMNPALSQKMEKIEAEITLADGKIQKLRDLKNAFPNQAQIVEQRIHQWQTLKDQLSQVLNDINQKVETAYVAYRVNEIQGKQKWSVLSTELLNEANTVLENAETTKSVIEESAYE
jgi:hypothetical protein